MLFWFQVRDYIHVVDLAEGHIAALQKLDDAKIGILYLCFFSVMIALDL